MLIFLVEKQLSDCGQRQKRETPFLQIGRRDSDLE